jgi:hypothetical protein
MQKQIGYGYGVSYTEIYDIKIIWAESTEKKHKKQRKSYDKIMTNILDHNTLVSVRECSAVFWLEGNFNYTYVDLLLRYYSWQHNNQVVVHNSD